MKTSLSSFAFIFMLLASDVAREDLFVAEECQMG